MPADKVQDRKLYYLLLQSCMMKKLIFFLLTILIAHKLMAQTTTPKTETENKPTIAILDGFANAFNAHDVDRILSYMTDDCIKTEAKWK